MRLVTRSLPVLVVAGLLGCSQTEPFHPRVDDADIGRIEMPAELDGHDVETRADGAWSYRSTTSAAVAGSKIRRELRTRSGAAALGAPAPRPAKADGDFRARAEHSFDSGDEAGSDGLHSEISSERMDEARVAAHRAAPAPSEGSEVEAEPTADPSTYAEDIAGPTTKKAKDRRRGEVMPRPSPAAQTARTLKAGSTDDNADYAKYLEFLDTWVQKKEIHELFQPMDVSGRRWLRVVDVNGDPVPGAVVTVVDEAGDRVLYSGRTYGDGRAAFYPNLEAPPVRAGDGPGTLVVEAHLADDEGDTVYTRIEWDGAGDELELALDVPTAIADPVPLDVCFLIDTTGSMGDEIASIKGALLAMTEKLRGMEREFDLRYSAVLYRDIGDEYLTARHPFTNDIEAFDEALRAVQANGGGDGPESLNQGLAEAVDRVDWRPDAAKVMFLIADAQPHMDYPGDVPYGESLKAAVGKGIRIHSVAASGLNPVGTLVFRQIAQMTRGKFIFIEYGSTAASAKSHGVTGNVKSNNLEDILFEQIQAELATYGRSVE